MSIKDSPTLQWSTSYVMEVVLRVVNPSTALPGGDVYMKRVANVGPLVFVNLSTASFEVTSTYDVSVMPDGGLGTSAHRIRGAYDVPSSTITAQVDVLPPVTKVLEAGVTGEGAAGTDVALGFNGINGYLNADVAEIVAVAASTIDPQDIVKLQAYLDAKYGL